MHEHCFTNIFYYNIFLFAMIATITNLYKKRIHYLGAIGTTNLIRTISTIFKFFYHH